jgi:hypothetical protein
MKFLFTTILVISFFLPCTAQNLVARVEKNGVWSLINEKGEHIIPYLYGHIHAFGDGLAAFRLDGDWGFIDKTGKIIISAQYGNTGIFASGRAAVSYDLFQWKYINKEGKDATQKPFLKVRKSNDSVFFAQSENETGFALYNYKGELLSKINAYKDAFPFKNGVGIVKVNAKTWQYIDVKGKVLYEGEVGFLKEFQDGMAMYRKNGLWGYIDSTFKESIPASFIEARPFRNGYAHVTNSKKRTYIIDKTGNPLKYSMLEAGDYSDGLIRVKNNGKWGYININGEVVIPFDFEKAKDFSEGLALVKIKKHNWGYINHKGELIIQPDLLAGKDVYNGFALVRFASGLWGFIDSKGVALKGEYDHASKFENVSNENPEEETDSNNDADVR